MKKPLISIITSTYNSEKTLLDTVNSIANQTYTNIEYIIVDGNSSDNTLRIIKKAQKIFQEKNIDFKFISEEDNGVYEAMNKGIKLAKGELIGVIGSDDWYEKDCFLIVAETYKKTNADFIHGHMNLYSENKIFLKKLKYGTVKEMKNRMSFFHPTSFIKKEVYNKLNNYSLDYRICSDYDLILRIINTNFNIVSINKVLTNFSFGGLSTTNVKEALYESHKIRVKNGYNKYYSLIVYKKALVASKIKKIF